MSVEPVIGSPHKQKRHCGYGVCMKTRIALLVTLFVASIGAQAATVTLIGDNISYEYDTGTNAGALALFGTPAIVGDTVRFLPNTFRAESLDGAGTDSAAATFIFDRIYSANGNAIQSMSMFEWGDYEISGSGDVSADLLLTAASNVAPEFTFASDSFDASGDSGGTLQPWVMMAQVNPAADFITPANDIALSIQNTLLATSDGDGDAAWIQKKLAFVATTVVPLPAAAWLFGSSLLGLLLVA